MAIIDPFKQQTEIVDPFKQTPDISTPPIQAATQPVSAPFVQQKPSQFESMFPSTSGGVEEIMKSGQYPSFTTANPVSGSFAETMRASIQGPAETLHALVAPMAEFLVGQPVAGVTGLMQRNPQEATASIEKTIKAISGLLGTTREYRYAEPHLIRGVMGAVFGPLNDAGDIVGDKLYEVTGSPALAAGGATLLKAIPILLGVKGSKTITKNVQTKLQTDRNFMMNYQKDVAVRDRIETFAKENYANFKSDLIEEFKKATEEGDTVKIERLKTIKDRIEVVMDEVLKTSEFDDVPIDTTEKPAGGSVRESQTTVEINGVSRPDLAEGFNIQGSGKSLLDDRGMAGFDINKAAQDAIEVGKQRYIEAAKELAGIEEEIVAIKERAKKEKNVTKEEVIQLAKRRKAAQDKVSTYELYKDLTIAEELDSAPEKSLIDEMKDEPELTAGPLKKDTQTSKAIVYKDLVKKAEDAGGSLVAKRSPNGGFLYTLEKDGAKYEFTDIRAVDEMFGAEPRKIEKQTNNEVKQEQVVSDVVSKTKPIEQEKKANTPLTFKEKSAIVRKYMGFNAAEANSLTKQLLEDASREKRKLTTESDLINYLDELESLGAEVEKEKGIVSSPAPLAVTEPIKTVETKPAKTSAKKAVKTEQPKEEVVVKQKEKPKEAKSLTEDQKAKFLDLAASWKSAESIAAELGADVESVRAYRTELGIPNLSQKEEYKAWRSKYKKEKYVDKNEQERKNAIERTKAETPEVVPTTDQVEAAKKELERRQREERLVETDSVSADSDFTVLENEPQPEPRYEFLEEAVKFYEMQEQNRLLGKQDIPSNSIMGLSRIVNVMRENVMRIESRTNLPLSKLFFDIQDGIKQEHMLSIPFRKRLAEARKGLDLSNASRIYRLLELRDFDERGMTFEQAMKAINSNEIWKKKFVTLSEREFNAAKEISNVLREAGEAFGIPLDRMLKDYAPRIREKGMTFDEAAVEWKSPELFKWWAEEEREGYLMPHEENIFRVADAYISRGARKKALGDPYEKFRKMVEDGRESKVLARTEYDTLQKFMRDVRNYPGILDSTIRVTAESIVRNLNKLIDKVSFGKAPQRYENVTYKRNKDGQLVEDFRDPGFINMDDIAGRFINWHLTSTYAGALGFRPIALLRNALQTLTLTMPVVGPKAFAVGFERAMTGKGMKEAKAAGVLLDDYLALGGEIEQGIGGKMQRVSELALAPYTKVDNFNRAVSFHAMKYLVESEGKQFFNAVKNSTDVAKNIRMRDEFLDNAELTFFHPLIIRDQFLPHLVNGDLEGLAKVAGKFMADETQFVYRRANSPVFMQGKLGKVFGQFGTYPVWYTSYLKHAVSRGSKAQIAKRIGAFMAINTILAEVGEEVFGVNLDKWFFLHPVMWSGGIGTSIMKGIAEYGYAAYETKDEYAKAKALNSIENGAAMHIPGFVQAKALVNAYQHKDFEDQVKIGMGFRPTK